MTIEATTIRFTIGPRQIWSAQRRLMRLSFSLDQLLSDLEVEWPVPDQDGLQGIRVLSAPQNRIEKILARYPDHTIGGLQCYRRFYIDMADDFDNYINGFSSKTRSTLRRKRRKLAEYNGGTIDVRVYKSPRELDEFLGIAVPLSRKTYQSRFLNSGLPENDETHTNMKELASANNIRAYLLFIDGKAVSYLYLPVENEILQYAYLGFDPALACLSPGTVLQIEALERLFAEDRFRYFDFTEGDGGNKALFGTSSVEACSFFLLRNDLQNRALLSCLSVFNGAVAAVRQITEKTGAKAYLQGLLRR